MRTLAAVLAAVFLLASVPSADAGWWIFGRDKKETSTIKKRLPKAIDSPAVRPRVLEHHKGGKTGGNHPEQENQIR